MSGPEDEKSRLPYWLLHRTEQAVVAFCVAAGLLATVVWWVSLGGLGGHVVEIERAEPQTAQFLVDINRAEWPELAQLPGIGEKLARRIVDVRQTHGMFLDHNDLRRVRGIGPKKLDALRPYLVPMADQTNMAADRRQELSTQAIP
jgi:competence protein ComEA